MATPFPIPVTAAQVGTYFVGQYYQVLQSQPDFVHQFYSDASTMLRIDGTTRETATGMLQIHALIMSLNYTGIEIKTAHSLESWNGGVLVMVSGSVQLKNLSGKRKCMQTFFLAPQEKGYFVLNDIFHFVDEEPIHHHPAILLAQSNLDVKFNTSSTIAEPVSNYLLGGEIQAGDFVDPADFKENGPFNNYSFTEQERQQISEPKSQVQVDNTAKENGTLENSLNAVHDQLPASVEEPVGEPLKHTYASILRVAKVQSATSVSPQPTVNKNMLPTSESNHASQDTQQAVASSDSFEWPGRETMEEFSAIEDEDEVKSVYVRNLLPTTSEAEIEEEFRKFGEIKPEGVVIRSRKDVGVCYAFVEFEDISGVHNAVRVGTAQVAGRPVYIEERRPNSVPYRVGRGRGRGRGSYQTDATRGRFGTRSLGRGSGYDGGDRDREYSRTRGNGYHRPSPRQDRGLSANQVSRSVHYQSEYAA